MIDLIKRLTEVQVNDVNLSSLVYNAGEIVRQFKKPNHRRKTLSKPMLLSVKQHRLFQKYPDVLGNNTI